MISPNVAEPPCSLCVIMVPRLLANHQGRPTNDEPIDLTNDQDDEKSDKPAAEAHGRRRHGKRLVRGMILVCPSSHLS